MNILITGANGHIGKALYSNLKDKYNTIGSTREMFDLTNTDATCKWFFGKQFDIVLHAAIVGGGGRLQKDNNNTIIKNITMFNNLLENKQHFSRLISFGSGEEIFNPNGSYAISKNIIAEYIRDTENFYNLRIFGLFDENGLSTRFIKANILRYINKQPMLIHTNKIMDFIYMKDLVSLVDHFVVSDNIPKVVNCCYEEKYTLNTIVNMINNLGNYKVPVIMENKKELQFYCEESNLPFINFVGLKNGLVETYNKLLFTLLTQTIKI